jgi:hypothetical protein
LQRRIEEQAENDRLRVQDMRDSFAEQKAEQDAERAIQIQRRAEDYQAQLTEMDTQHGLRLNQIRTNAIKEREALQTAADDALVALQAADAKTKAEHEKREQDEEKLWDKFHKHIADSLAVPVAGISGASGAHPLKAYADGGFVPQTGLAQLHGGEFVLSRYMLSGSQPIPPAISNAINHNSRSLSIGAISPTIVIGDTGGRSDDYIKRLVIDGMVEALGVI